METLIWLGIALLLAPALGEIAKVRMKAEKGFLWLGAAGAMFLVSATFGVDLTAFGLEASSMIWGTAIFGLIGMVLTIIGAIWILLNIFK